MSLGIKKSALVLAVVLAGSLLVLYPVCGDNPSYSECRPHIDATIRDLAAKAIIAGETPSDNLDYASAEGHEEAPAPVEAPPPPPEAKPEPEVPKEEPPAPPPPPTPAPIEPAPEVDPPPPPPAPEPVVAAPEPPKPVVEAPPPAPAAPVVQQPPEPVRPVEPAPQPVPSAPQPATPAAPKPAEQKLGFFDKLIDAIFGVPKGTRDPKWAQPWQTHPEHAKKVVEKAPEVEQGPVGPSGGLIDKLVKLVFPTAPADTKRDPKWAQPWQTHPEHAKKPAPVVEAPKEVGPIGPSGGLIDKFVKLLFATVPEGTKRDPKWAQPWQTHPEHAKKAAPVVEEPKEVGPIGPSGGLIDKFVKLLFATVPEGTKRDPKWAQPWQTHPEHAKKAAPVVEEPKETGPVGPSGGIIDKFVKMIFVTVPEGTKRDPKWAQPWQTHPEHAKKIVEVAKEPKEEGPVGPSGGIIDKFVKMVFVTVPEGSKRDPKWATPWQTHPEHRKEAKPIEQPPPAAPQPAPVPEPVVAPKPAVAPEPVAAPAPPVKAPEPEPVKVPEPEPVKVPEPEPVKVPEPEPVKAPAPEPVAAPAPKPIEAPPAPAPEVAKAPEPVPEPKMVVEEPVVEKVTFPEEKVAGEELVVDEDEDEDEDEGEDEDDDDDEEEEVDDDEEEEVDDDDEEEEGVDEDEDEDEDEEEEEGGVDEEDEDEDEDEEDEVEAGEDDDEDEDEEDGEETDDDEDEEDEESEIEEDEDEDEEDEDEKEEVVDEDDDEDEDEAEDEEEEEVVDDDDDEDDDEDEVDDDEDDEDEDEDEVEAKEEDEDEDEEEDEEDEDEDEKAVPQKVEKKAEEHDKRDQREMAKDEDEDEDEEDEDEDEDEDEIKAGKADDEGSDDEDEDEDEDAEDSGDEGEEEDMEKPEEMDDTEADEEEEEEDKEQLPSPTRPPVPSEPAKAAPVDTKPLADAPEAPKKPVLAEEVKKEVAEEEEEQIVVVPSAFRSRDRLESILGLDESSRDTAARTDPIAEATLKDLKRIYETTIRPLESLYKYQDISNRHVSDAELFGTPLILMLGPYSTGKSTFINYMLGVEYTKRGLKTGTPPSHGVFRIIQHGDKDAELDGTDLSAHWSFTSLQKFGQNFIDQIQGKVLQSPLLKKVTFVEAPGILEMRRPGERLYPYNDVVQWFIDRADLILVMFDYTKLDAGYEMEAILDQLKGREAQTRILLNKADQVPPEELIKVQGSLFWNLSPLLGVSTPPTVYAGSFASRPYRPGSPAKLFEAQEDALLTDIAQAINSRVDNRIAIARRHAVRVRNHAQMVDTYLTTYYKNKGFLTSKHKLAEDIIENPHNYNIYEGMSLLTNISRYDLPDPEVYRDFFRVHNLYDFQTLKDTCSYFRGCPLSKIDGAISHDLPELLDRHRRLLEAAKAGPGKSAGEARVPTPGVRGGVPPGAHVRTS